MDAHTSALPGIGLGTWQMRGETCRAAVEHALRCGYRHLDTAQLYANEAEVGRGLADSGVARQDVFITSKVWRDNLAYDDVIRSTEASLRELGSGYIDLMLLHWPHTGYPWQRSLDALVVLQDRGLVRHIGVSNYRSELLAQAAAHAPLRSTQLEFHVYLHVDPVLAVAREHGMAVAAYCPLARGKVVEDPLLARIGESHGRSAAQVALRWLVQQDNVVAIPKSSHPARLEANLAALDFALTPAEMRAIDALGRGERLIDPPFCTWD